MEPTDEKVTTPEWLRNIQHGSWEPELIISGGTVFTLFQLPAFLSHQSQLMVQASGFFEPLIIVHYLLIAVNGLTAGFVGHLLLRGFWIGMVCLSYVFPNGSNKERLKYAPPFQQHIDKTPHIVRFVDILEKACSLVFALSFIFFLLVLGTLIVSMVLIPHTGLEETLGVQVFSYLKILSIIGLGLGLVYLIDFLSLGWLQRQPFIARFYYPIYRFFNALSLAFLYRTAYYTFASNVKPLYVFLTVVSYFVASFGITAILSPINEGQQDTRHLLQFENDMTSFNPSYYENLRDEEQLVRFACIQADVIQGSQLKLFVVHPKVIEFALPETDWSKFDTDKKRMDKLLSLYEVYLDEKRVYPSGKPRYFVHPHTGESGVIFYLSLKDVVHGEHSLSIQLDVTQHWDESRLQRFGIDKSLYAYIPFWKE